MRYLLDVNALLALGCVKHVHHMRVGQWLRNLREREGENAQLATCAITELGFIRVASGKAALVENLAVAQADMERMKADGQFIFLGDELAASRMPAWVAKSDQTTDGHLLELAIAHRARLVTLDTGIPGAELIPEWTGTGLMVREERLPYGMAA